MYRPNNEYEKAKKLTTVSLGGNDSFKVIQKSGKNLCGGENMGNILLAGQGTMKLNWLLELMTQVYELPVIVVSDSKRSRLSSCLQNETNFHYSFVRHSGESAFYNFLMHKSIQEKLLFFTQIANEYGLFEHPAEAEKLLKCILELSIHSTKIFQEIAEDCLTEKILQNEINRQYKQSKLTNIEKNKLEIMLNSSIASAQNISAAYNGLFSMISNMHGFPFSIKDIVDQKRRVCFCLDGNMGCRSRCWYLAKMLSYDLADYFNKFNGSFILILDLSNKEKLELFSDFIGLRNIKIILNVEHTEYLSGNFSTSYFQELYVFTHPDLNSAKYWSEYFAAHRVAEYEYSDGHNSANKFSLRFKTTFEVNDIRELSDFEFIYYNHAERVPMKCILR